jgi:putative ABC transport system permease protein
MFRRFLHRFRSLFRKGRLEREMEKELRFHLEMEAEKNIGRGMNEEEARLAAQRSFGGIDQTKEAYRDLVRFRLVEDLWQDLHYGARMLSKNPGFTLIAVLALALGIGANTAIFSVVNAVLLKPLPYYDPQRLVFVTEDKRGKEGGWEGEVPGSIDYILWQAESKVFDHLVAFNWGNTYLTERGEPERLDSVWTTANLFPALGVAPQLGRAFTPEEDRPGGTPVVILSHAFWQRRFGGDPAIIGQSLTLDRESRQVIGVMPPDFKFIYRADVLLPLAINAQLELTRNVKGTRYLLGYIFGRLKSGVSVEQARSELDSLLQRGKKADPKLMYGDKAIVTPLGERLVGHLRHGLLLLFGAVGSILLIACANVASLMLARARVRQKEMAIRAALGAGRRRLVRQMLTESLLLSVCGGIAGLLLALLGVNALAPLIPADLAHLKESGPSSLIDGIALGFTFLAGLLTGVIAGIIPALQASQIDRTESLKEGARSAAFSQRIGARRVSPALVAGELALTLVLLVGAGLLIKSYLRVLAVGPGYNPENLLTMAIPLSRAGYSLAQKRLFHQELLTRINSLPGVKIAAVGPLPQRKGVSSGTYLGFTRYVVSADYFRATGVHLRAGRGFTEQDSEGAPPVVVINETYARRHFAGEDPIGKRITYGFDGPRRIYGTIVGVVADIKRYGLESEVGSEEYHSVLQGTEWRDLNLVARTAGDPLKLAAAVRGQVWAIDANVPVVDVMSMEERLAESVAPRRFQMLLFGAFAVVALVLAAVGVYGLISHSVSRRTHEIGIRMALGARPCDVLALVIRQGMSLALVGIAIGLASALALARVMASFLFNVKTTDPAIFAGISLLLLIVAFLAAFFPARRATKVDPMVALRHE